MGISATQQVKKSLLFLFFLILSCTITKAQEICNNGIDDDADGFIDCFDSKCASNPVCNGNYIGNDIICQAKPTTFPVFSMKLLWASANSGSLEIACR